MIALHSQAGSTISRRAATATDLLADSQLLRSPFLCPNEVHALAEAISSPMTIASASDLVREGECACDLFIMIEGWAYQYVTTRQGGRQLPALLIPGDIANLGSLMLDRLDYGVRTLGRALVASLPRDRARALALAHPGIARTFTWRAMVETVGHARSLLSLARRSAGERIAHLLCELSVRLRAEDANVSRFELPLTQEQIADAIGLTSVHVNRMIQQLRGTGLIVTDGRSITLPDVARLRRLGGFDPRYLHLEPPLA